MNEVRHMSHSYTAFKQPPRLNLFNRENKNLAQNDLSDHRFQADILFYSMSWFIFDRLLAMIMRTQSLWAVSKL